MISQVHRHDSKAMRSRTGTLHGDKCLVMYHETLLWTLTYKGYKKTNKKNVKNKNSQMQNTWTQSVRDHWLDSFRDMVSTEKRHVPKKKKKHLLFRYSKCVNYFNNVDMLITKVLTLVWINVLYQRRNSNSHAGT